MPMEQMAHARGLGGQASRATWDVTATDRDAAIAKAIETFAITEPERQRRVIVRPIAER